MKILVIALTLLLLPGIAGAACPMQFETVRGTSGDDVLKGTQKKSTRFFGNGGNDRIVVENPVIYGSCDARNYEDHIGDYGRGDIIDAPGPQTIVRFTRIINTNRCYVYWSGSNFVILENCSAVLKKADVKVQ